MQYIMAFVVGGVICAVAQILIDRTKMTPARIVVLFVVSGVVLSAFGVYDKLVEIGGAGATVPISGFGYSLAKGVEKAVASQGLLGVLTGGITATAAGITGAIFFGFIMSLAFKPKAK